MVEIDSLADCPINRAAFDGEHLSELPFGSSYVELGFHGEALSQVVFSWRDRFSSPIFAPVCMAHAGVQIWGKESSIESGTFATWLDPYNGRKFALTYGECVLDGYGNAQGGLRPWTFFVAFVFDRRLPSVAGHFSTRAMREAPRRRPARPARWNMPRLILREHWLENGAIKSRDWVDHTYSQADFSQKEFSISDTD